MIKQNRMLSSGCHTVARRLPLRAFSAPSSFTEHCHRPLSHPHHPSKRSPASNQCFTAAFRIFDHMLAVFVLDLSVTSPTGPVLLLLLIWTPASSAVKHLSVCRQHSCGEKPASHHSLHTSNTPQLKALK